MISNLSPAKSGLYLWDNFLSKFSHLSTLTLTLTLTLSNLRPLDSRPIQRESITFIYLTLQKLVIRTDSFRIWLLIYFFKEWSLTIISLQENILSKPKRNFVEILSQEFDYMINDTTRDNDHTVPLVYQVYCNFAPWHSTRADHTERLLRETSVLRSWRRVKTFGKK